MHMGTHIHTHFFSRARTHTHTNTYLYREVKYCGMYLFFSIILCYFSSNPGFGISSSVAKLCCKYYKNIHALTQHSCC